MRHPRPWRRRQGHAAVRENGSHDVLDRVEHVVLDDEGHLEVELGELGLAIRAQVLVAEAARDLEVTLEAADHEQLLEELRRLRQRVPRPTRECALGTRKSRAPSGVERVRIGVSISRKSRSSSTRRISATSSWRSVSALRIAPRRRSSGR